MEPWPELQYDLRDEPRFLFIATPAYSGSTALAEILITATGTTFLHTKAEGQWLVPGLCDKDRWNPDKVVNWSSVRSVWLHRLQHLQNQQSVELVIEKSPPHIVRFDQLLQAFPNHIAVAFNRDPYANCSSILYRNHDPSTKTADERLATVARLAANWLFRARWIKRWIDKFALPFFKYEDFCANPAGCLRPIQAQAPILDSIDARKEIKIKDYELQTLTNLNDAQIAKLLPAEIELISRTLRTDVPLLTFFRYELR